VSIDLYTAVVIVRGCSTVSAPPYGRHYTWSIVVVVTFRITDSLIFKKNTRDFLTRFSGHCVFAVMNNLPLCIPVLVILSVLHSLEVVVLVK